MSGDPLPSEIKKCIGSWEKHLSGYEVWLWDTKRFDVNSTPWTKQAFEAKKYAFAADYIRLYALYNYGGIYLDSDVLVYKNFDELLSLPYFIGHDQIRGFEAAVIGAEKGCKWVKDVFDTYGGKSFIKDDGSYDMMELPVRFHHVLVNEGYRFYRLREVSAYAYEEKIMYVFDGDFFNSRNAIEVRKTKKSFCAHNYAGSWNDKKESDGNGLKQRIPKWLAVILYRAHQSLWARKKYRWFQIPFDKE